MAGPMPRISFIKGQSKNPIVPGVCVIDERFKFFFNKVISDGKNEKPVSLFYLCSMKKTSKCSASVILFKEGDRWWANNLSPVEEHNHVCEKSEILAHKLKKDIYERVKNNPTDNADNVYRSVVTEYEDQHGENNENVWDDATTKLTDKNHIARNVRRIKANINGPLPSNRNQFKPEDVVRNTLGGRKVVVLDSNCHLDEEYETKMKEFITDQYQSNNGLLNSFVQSDTDSTNDSADDSFEIEDVESSTDESDEDDGLENYTRTKKPKRVVIYTTKNLVKLFAEGRKSSGDGTFKASPSLWKQIFIIMVKLGKHWIPVCYAMLPDKTKQSYFTMFYMLKLYMKENNVDFNIESIRLDFEVATMKAVTATWDVLIKGCYFHFTQAGWRFVQRNNMAKVYLSEADEDFNDFVQSVLALPHVRLEDVQDTLYKLDEQFEFEDEDKEAFKKKYLKYVQEYWIDGQIPPQVWNCFRRKVDLTNNNQGCHP